MFEILPQSEGANIAIKASGTIRETDYEEILPQIEQLLQNQLRFRLLLDWELLEKWDEQVDAVAFGVRFSHRYRCERLAIVSDDPRRKKDIEKFRGILLRSAELKVFSAVERDAAWSWLTCD